MSYEITAIISGIFFIVGIIILQLFWERKYKFNLDFEKFKIRERKKATKDKYKLQIKNPAPKDVNFWLSKIKDLNPEVVANILDAVSNEEAGSEGLFDSLGEGIGDFIQNNPKLVQGFLNKYLGNQEEENNEDIYSNR